MPIYTPGKVVLRQTSSAWAEGGDLVYTIVDSGTTYRVHEFKTVGTSSLNVMTVFSFAPARQGMFLAVPKLLGARP